MRVEAETPSRTASMVPVAYRVRSRRQDLDDTITLTMEPVDDAIAKPSLGQFNMLWAFGIGEAPISLAGIGGRNGAGDGVLVHTIRAVGAVTKALCELRAGDELGVRGPYGTGWDLDGARGRDVLIAAGGLGLAPVRPIIEELLDRRTEFGRASLLMGARNPESLLYRDELEQWRGRLDIEVEVTVDAAPRSWRGDVGVVTTLIDRAPFDPADTRAFVCGPEIMMRFAAQALIDRGVRPAEVFVSLERNMHCAIGHCGHCQLGPFFICKEGPVLPWVEAEPVMRVRER